VSTGPPAGGLSCPRNDLSDPSRLRAPKTRNLHERNLVGRDDVMRAQWTFEGGAQQAPCADRLTGRAPIAMTPLQLTGFRYESGLAIGAFDDFTERHCIASRPPSPRTGVAHVRREPSAKPRLEFETAGARLVITPPKAGRPSEARARGTESQPSRSHRVGSSGWTRIRLR
jgi:hypothetical protein